MRRTVRQLETALRQATTRGQKALAHYRLAIFHDNNNREKMAIPHYRLALRLGLSGKRKSEAHVWLASSLYKTGQPVEARKHLHQALRLTRSVELKRFLGGLEKKIIRLGKSCSGKSSYRN